MHLSPVSGTAPAYQGYSYRSVSISAVGRGLIALGPAAACLALADGSVSFNASGTQAWIYALAFAALAIVASAKARSGRQIPIPWFCAVVPAWPLAQLAPLGAIAARVEPQRSADFQMLSGLGVSPAPAISLYPYATAHGFLALAGSVALFLLAREAGRAPGALAWLAAGILLLGWAEILPALRQWAQLQTGAVAVATPGADFMRGTFGNRNLLCAWLEGCYGVALSLTLACLAGQNGGRQGMGWRSPGRPAMRAIDLLAIVTAAGCVVVVAGSASRMGIVTLVGETALLASWQLRRNRRTLLITGVLTAIVTGVVIGAGASGVVARFSPASIRLERQGRLAMWADSIRAVRRRPLLGAGLGCFPFAFRRSHSYFTGYTIDHPHNEYLEATVECGIPFTLMLGAWAAAGLWRRARSAQLAAEGHKEIAVGCLAGVLAILAHGAVDFPLRIPAILGLVSVLLGAAFAHARLGRQVLPEDSPGCDTAAGTAQTGWKSGWLAATAALGMAGLSLWSVPPADGVPRRLERWNAEAYYRVARADFDQVRMARALDGYWQAVRANPYAARVWSELALVAEAQGDRRLALRLSALAVDLEPHARWSQWAVGNLRLRLGDMDGALALLEPLVSQTPEMRRPVWDACWKAGMPGDQILARLTNKFPDDLEDYLRYLRSRRWATGSGQGVGSRQ